MRYFYENIKVLDVYDADTITVLIELGFDVAIKVTLRLYGINAPELKGEEREQGLKSRDYLRERILEKQIKIETLKDAKEKYGRYLAKIYDLEGKCLNDELVEKNLAVYKEY